MIPWDDRRCRIAHGPCDSYFENLAKYSAAGNNISMTEKDRNDHRPRLCHVCGKPGDATMFCPCQDALIYCVGCYDQVAQVMNGSNMKEKERFALCPRCRTAI